MRHTNTAPLTATNITAGDMSGMVCSMDAGKQKVIRSSKMMYCIVRNNLQLIYLNRLVRFYEMWPLECTAVNPSNKRQDDVEILPKT